MLYLDNIIFSLQKVGGISMVWYHLLNHVLRQSDLYVNFIEYAGAANNEYRKLLKLPASNLTVRDADFLSFKRYFAPYIEITDDTIFHSSYYRVIDHPHAKNITTVHDFTYEHFSSGMKAYVHKWQKFKAIKHSEIIVCISQNTRRDLLHFMPEVKSKKIEVIYNGVSEEYFPTKQNYPEYSDCLMFIGSRATYKNFNFAIEAALSSGYRLLICGAPLNEAEKKHLQKRLGNNRFILKVRPSNSEINKLYNSVRALIYPSSYEGFGLPVIEAQKAGCPVIALNSSSIPEVIGDEYPMMNDLSITSFTAVLQKIENSSSHETLINYGLQNSKRFSWENMSENYIQLYNSI